MQRIPHFFLSKRQSVDFIMQGDWTKALREADRTDAPEIEQRTTI